jgi:hypothetical protein
MPGLVPGIHVLFAMWQSVDGRDKPGHDGFILAGIQRQNPHHCPNRSIRAGACTWSAL